jgi:hypothetical protein
MTDGSFTNSNVVSIGVRDARGPVMSTWGGVVSRE